MLTTMFILKLLLTLLLFILTLMSFCCLVSSVLFIHKISRKPFYDKIYKIKKLKDSFNSRL